MQQARCVVRRGCVQNRSLLEVQFRECKCHIYDSQLYIRVPTFAERKCVIFLYQVLISLQRYVAPENPQTPMQSGQPGKPANSGKSANSDKSAKSDKSPKQDKSGKPQTPAPQH
ncbi:hypothetical protein PGTUg99_027332 [Puccinia graminis f. sp. tritici]|uniref:Uncharacterized protein n=1 Tax=Puccinia graminis f. sp. tritici TaxID=56615 RepID=A0A5B0S059_PUCGR|nr:hypothetical protein PGTUg99_027332 [Puccinia graminis f. sp. tritici]